MTDHQPPDQLTGRDFEHHINLRLDKLKELRLACIGKYGVKVRFDTMQGAYQPIRSLPDYEGAFTLDGTQTIFDAKVCSQASFDLSKYRIDENSPKALQLKHMYERSDFGCCCFFLIHWNKRELKKSTVDAVTYAMPVSRHHAFWERFEKREVKSLNLRDMEEFAVKVEWNVLPNERTARPDVLAAIEELHSARAKRVLVRNSVLGRWA